MQWVRSPPSRRWRGMLPRRPPPPLLLLLPPPPPLLLVVAVVWQLQGGLQTVPRLWTALQQQGEERQGRIQQRQQ